MGCGSSSLKGTEDVGTSQPAVPISSDNQQAAGGAPMKKVRTNFSNINYDVPAEKHKGSLLKARAPDETDEGPSRNTSVNVPQEETIDEVMEKKPQEGTLEPYQTLEEEQGKSSIGASRRTSLMGLLTGTEGKRKKSQFTDAELKRYAGITREELDERAKIPPEPAPTPRYGSS